MDLIKVFQKWPTHESCIEYLETVRWGVRPACPLCGSLAVARKSDGHRVGRWNCHDCKSSFNVLSGTIFQKTKIDLQKWFLAIAVLLNAKKSVSSYQLARNLDLTQPITDAFNAYREMGRRVRHAVIDHSIQYVDGLIHTNTIEGFWSLLKRAWYGTHHHYSDNYALAYSVEACYKYNSRNAGDTFASFIRGAVAAW